MSQNNLCPVFLYWETNKAFILNEVCLEKKKQQERTPRAQSLEDGWLQTHFSTGHPSWKGSCGGSKTGRQCAQHVPMSSAAYGCLTCLGKVLTSTDLPCFAQWVWKQGPLRRAPCADLMGPWSLASRVLDSVSVGGLLSEVPEQTQPPR